MSCEYDALEKNGTWFIMDFPPVKKPIECHWIFTIINKSNGDQVEQYKLRLVAYENKQEESVSYEKTFTTVVKMTIVWTFLKVVAVKQWKIH